MVGQYILAGGVILSIFFLFLVLSTTLNNIINQLLKLEYLLEKERDLQNEVLTIKQMLGEDFDLDD